MCDHVGGDVRHQNPWWPVAGICWRTGVLPVGGQSQRSALPLGYQGCTHLHSAQLERGLWTIRLSAHIPCPWNFHLYTAQNVAYFGCSIWKACDILTCVLSVSVYSGEIKSVPVVASGVCSASLLWWNTDNLDKFKQYKVFSSCVCSASLLWWNRQPR